TIFFHDVSPRVKSELEARDNEALLQASETRLRLALAATRSGIWDWNLSSAEVTWTRELEELWGVERERHGYADFAAAIVAEDRAVLEQKLGASLLQGVALRLQFRV